MSKEQTKMNQLIIPCLWYDDNAEEAARWYTTIFNNATITNTTPNFVESPSNQPKGSVMTVDFQILGFKFVGLNGGPEFKMNPSISFLVKCNKKEEVDLIWDGLSDEATVLMPLMSYPFSDHYGWLQDKYGVPWQIMLVDHEYKQRIIPTMLFVGDQCGNAENAMNMYTEIFNDGDILDITRYESEKGPDEVGTIKHGIFILEEQQFAAMDSALQHNFNFSEAISLMRLCKNQEEIDHLWSNLSADEAAGRCGWLKDKFGVSWQIVPENLDEMLNSSDTKKAEKVMDTLLDMKKLDIEKLEHVYNH